MRRSVNASAALWMSLPLVGCGSDFALRGRDAEVEAPVYATERFEQEANPQADVLWVVGNSPSMAQEQAALADAFPAFVAALDQAGLSYHLGVITPEAAGDDAGVLQGAPWIVTPAAEDPAADFAQAVEVGVGGSGPEAGLSAIVTALTEPTRSGANRGFRRADAVLQVVVVSDDDDESEQLMAQDPVESVLTLLEAELEAGAPVAQLSAVVGDPEDGCTGSGGAARPGTRYAEVALQTGGVVADICAGDLSAVLAQLSGLSLVYTDRFALQATPLEGTVRVAVDGARQDAGWALVLDPPAVVFDAAPPAGALIEVRYRLPPEEGS